MRYSDKQSRIWRGSYYPLSKVLKEELPEIIEATRYQAARNLLIKHGERRFNNDVVGLADPSFFETFTFSFIAGNPETALSGRTSAVLTETMARKYFGKEDPLGKTLTFNSALDIQVTGVIADDDEVKFYFYRIDIKNSQAIGKYGQIPLKHNPMNRIVLYGLN